MSAIASTHARVAVAMPLRWLTAFNAGRSARKRLWVDDVTAINSVSGSTGGTFLNTHVTCHVIAADHFEDRSSHHKPGDDSTTASHQSQAPALLHRHGRHRCDINASVDIFFQGPDSQRFNIEGTKARVCEQRNRLGRQSVGRVGPLDLRVLE